MFALFFVFFAGQADLTNRIFYVYVHGGDKIGSFEALTNEQKKQLSHILTLLLRSSFSLPTSIQGSTQYLDCQPLYVASL